MKTLKEFMLEQLTFNESEFAKFKEGNSIKITNGEHKGKLEHM